MIKTRVRRIFALLLAATVWFVGYPASTPLARAADYSITLVACQNYGSVGDMITARVKTDPPGLNTTVHSQVLIAGTWQMYDQGWTDAAGNLELELNYMRDEVGAFRHRLVAYFPGKIVRYTQEFDVFRAPYVELLSAPSVSRAGTTITARGEARNFGAGTGFSEVLTPTGWRRSQQASINPATGQFVIPLTYGATAPGTYRWRLGSTMNGATGRSQEFTIVRTPNVVLLSAQGTVPAGVLTSARGRTYPMTAGHIGFAQVWHGASWVTISAAVTTASGDFYTPLKYGVGTAGTYKFRLGSTLAGTTYYTSAFQVTRT